MFDEKRMDIIGQNGNDGLHYNQLTEFAEQTLADRYFQEGVTSSAQAFRRAAEAYSDSPEMAEKMTQYISAQWLSLATPVLSNAPKRSTYLPDWVGNHGVLPGFEVAFKKECYTGKIVGLPISCFLNYVPDSRKGLGDHYEENIWLASGGGGIGGFWGHIRSDGSTTSNGSVSTGSIPFLHVVDSQMLAFNQGKTRRGSYAAYTDIWHPEVVEFLEVRKPTGGDSNRKCLNLHHGINVSDEFMEKVDQARQGILEDDSWPLIDPDSGLVVDTVSVKELWERILHLRATTGEPYIHFIDQSNRFLPEKQKALGLKVYQSNLCSEITLPTNEERTAVCCLSSLNLEYWDEWKDDPEFIPLVVRYLDNVLEYFIQNAKNMPKAVYSASHERSIGIGALGFHAYLQSRSIPFESAMADGLNRQIFEHIKTKAVEGTEKLAEERGEAPDMEGTGRRNAHLLSIAPNASSSIICNTSPSIEPWKANAFTHRTLSGSHLVKNKFLEKKLEELGQNTSEVWKSIITNEGSVQHLDFLDEWDKDVFKTAEEIDGRWIIDHAANRQPFICQSQSVNLFIPNGMDIKNFSHLHLRAWKKGLKTLYYVRSAPARRAENLNVKVAREILTENWDNGSECLSCEG